MEEALINLVAVHKCLWEKGSKEYRDKLMKENAWASISSVINLPVSECVSKWKYIREKYVRAKEANNLNSRSGAAGGKSKIFPHMELLGFLTKHIKKRSSWSSLALPSTSQRSNATSITSEITRPHKAHDTINFFSNEMHHSADVNSDDDVTDVEFLDMSLLDDTIEAAVSPGMQTPDSATTNAQKKDRLKKKGKNKDSPGVNNIEVAMDAVKEAASAIRTSITPPSGQASPANQAFGNQIAFLLEDMPNKERLQCMKDTLDLIFSVKMGLNQQSDY